MQFVPILTGGLRPAGNAFVDRGKVIDQLIEATSSEGVRLVNLVGCSGVGKVTVMHRWIEELEKSRFGDIECVYGWSFHAQGGIGDAVSCELLLDSALRSFGVANPSQGNTADKLDEFLQCLQRRQTLLLLDGVDLLQFQSGNRSGMLRDPTLAFLLREFSRSERGCCIFATQKPLKVRREWYDSASKSVTIESLTDTEGAQFMRSAGVSGDLSALTAAARLVRGHPLSLLLLNAFLKEKCGGDIRYCSKMGQPDDGQNSVSWLLKQYETILDERERQILNLLAIVNQPATQVEVLEWCSGSGVGKLTESLRGLSNQELRQLVARLRNAGLFSEVNEDSPSTLDMHPLVRKFFRDSLRTHSGPAWREAHDHLYGYFARSKPVLPETVSEMVPLYRALSHGCQGNLHKAAYDDVYRPRIRRDGLSYHIHTLGITGPDFAAIQGFFAESWQEAGDELEREDVAWLLNTGGFHLRKLGMLEEAVEPIVLSFNLCRELGHLREASLRATNLSEIHVLLGNLNEAMDYAIKGNDLANERGDPFRQINARVQMADVLHQVGRLDESHATFRDAAELQRRSTGLSLLYSVAGFRYCDLGLGQAEWILSSSPRRGNPAQIVKITGSILRRTELTLPVAETEEWPLDIALDHLSIGRALLLDGLYHDGARLDKAGEFFDRSVRRLQQMGELTWLPSALLARSMFYRFQDRLDDSKEDLLEAWESSRECGLKLYETDSHLEYVRWLLANGDRQGARTIFDVAKTMVRDFNYRRRDLEVRELQKQV